MQCKTVVQGEIQGEIARDMLAPAADSIKARASLKICGLVQLAKAAAVFGKSYGGSFWVHRESRSLF